MGRAAAVAAAPGRRVALSGRRPEPLAETAAQIERAGGEALVLPLDARDGAAVSEAHAAITSAWGGVDDLVLSAGLNTPQRTWADQSIAAVEEVIATNLTAVARTVDAVLPDLRSRGGGQVVVVSSYAGWRYSPYAGVAYSASKPRWPRCARRSTPRRPSTASAPATCVPVTWTPTSWSTGPSSPERIPGR